MYFNTPKIKIALISEIGQNDSILSSSARTLKKQCQTRWVQKYESLSDFVELLLFVVKTLKTISSIWGIPFSTDTNILVKSVLDFEFFISLYVKKINLINFN